MPEQTYKELVANALGSILDAPFNAARAGLARGPEHILPGLLQQEHVDATELPGIRDLPDQGPDLGPLHITPRTLAGFGANAGIGLAAGASAAGLKRGLGSSALRDFAADETGSAGFGNIPHRSDLPKPAINASYEVGGQPAVGQHAPETAPVKPLGVPERGSSLPLHNQPAEGVPTPPADQVIPDTRGPIRNPRGPAFNQDMARDADPAVIRPRVRTETDLSGRPPIPVRDSGEFPNDHSTTPPAPSIGELKAQANDHAVRIHALLDDPEQAASEHGNSPGLQQMIDRYQALQDQIRDAEAGNRQAGIDSITGEPGFRQGVYKEGVRRRNSETYYREIPELDQAEQSDVALGAKTDPRAQFRTNPDGTIKRFNREDPSADFRTGRMVEDPNGTHGLVEPLAEQIRTGARPVTRPQVTYSGKLKIQDRTEKGITDTRARLQPPEIRTGPDGQIVRDSAGQPVQDWDTADPQRLETARAAGDPRALAAVRTNISDSAAKSLEGDVQRRGETIYKATHDATDPLRGSRLRRHADEPQLASDEFGNETQVTRQEGGIPDSSSADTSPPSSITKGGAFRHLDERPASPEDQQFGSELEREHTRDEWRSRDSSQSTGTNGRGAPQGTRSGRELPTLTEFAEDNGIDTQNEDIPQSYKDAYKARYGEGADAARRDEGGTATSALREQGHADINAETAAQDSAAQAHLIKWLRARVSSGAISDADAKALLDDGNGVGRDGLRGGKTTSDTFKRANEKQDIADTLAPGTAQARSAQGVAQAPERISTPRVFKRPPNAAGEAAYARIQAAGGETQDALDQIKRQAALNSRWIPGPKERAILDEGKK